ICNLVYDIDVRLLFIELADDPVKQTPSLRLVFPEITHFSEKNNLQKPDDEYVDDLVSIEEIKPGTLQINTYKKTLCIELAQMPYREKIK
ncbi:MAG: hypothetical protein KDI30_09735, partial [Pseudomonadales bacterium]|nr:hypothetical protein [Pseudomonadales bacterium]